MPTPASNPPLDPTPPPSYSFSTCPDDIQHSSHSSQPTRDEMTPGLESTPERRSQSPRGASSLDSDSQPSRRVMREESLLADDRISAEPSSRATTVSPRPRSSATAATSPPPETSSTKSRELLGASSLDQTAMSDEIMPVGVKPSGVESDESESELSDDNTQSSCFAGLEYSNKRSVPISPSSFLRAGTKFHGTQQSERQVYDVQVEIKYVDMRESFLCGYLRIQGLTEDHPTLTTYFEGEIIGPKYSFLTQHEDWGARAETDISHWAKFPAFQPYAKQGKKGLVVKPDVAQKEVIFMRWKEHFLVPDHRVRTIHGASFEGFYYISFNQIAGKVSGIYFHSKSEKFQQLELKHVPDRGCFTAMEFR